MVSQHHCTSSWLHLWHRGGLADSSKEIKTHIVFSWGVGEGLGDQRPIMQKEIDNKSQLWGVYRAWFAVPSSSFALAPALLSAHHKLHRKHTGEETVLSPGQLRKTTIIKNNDALGF